MVSGFSVWALLFGSKYAYLKFFVDEGIDSDGSDSESTIVQGPVNPGGSLIVEGSSSAKGSTISKSSTIAKSLPTCDCEDKTLTKGVPTKEAVSGVASLLSDNRANNATSAHQL